MKVDYVIFRKRADRSNYIAHKFSKFLTGKVLDVGCDQAVLKQLLNHVDYVGIDSGGAPDIKINLEQISTLPFSDKEFNTIVCSDVLEHLDNLHFIFGELVRVARQYIIISLPNNWNSARKPIERGNGPIAHYGLPTTNPSDRHKWFFGLSEAIDFLLAQQAIYSISLIDTTVNEKPRPFLFRMARRIRHPSLIRYLNRYAHTVWVVYEKITPSKV